ncbi:unnamed protein product [Prunus brigantina]
MTGPPSSSYPSQVPPPAVEISPESRRQRLGFTRNFAGFVLRRPAAIFGDQGMEIHLLCMMFQPVLQSRFRPLPVFLGSCRIRRIVKRSPGYSGNGNPRARV